MTADEQRIRLKTLFEHWEMFRNGVIPKDSCDQQLRDMQMAFYTGALTALDPLFRDCGESIQGKSDILTGYRREIGLWIKEVFDRATE